MQRWGWFAAAYGLLSALAVSLAVWWLDVSPVSHPDPWLQLASPFSHLFSLLLGLALGGGVVLLTRVCVNRFGWAQRLHAELQPFARTISPAGVLVLALFSALGEELFFRGFMQPLVGLVGQAVVFGLLHQLPGTSRWVWAGSATVVGLAFGALFQLTGSLAGPIAAHALINGMNLNYLKNRDLGPPGRPLGGLLGHRG